VLDGILVAAEGKGVLGEALDVTEGKDVGSPDDELGVLEPKDVKGVDGELERFGNEAVTEAEVLVA
jgi:hypothetical protein